MSASCRRSFLVGTFFASALAGVVFAQDEPVFETPGLAACRVAVQVGGVRRQDAGGDAASQPLEIDVPSLDIPLLAINGEFDRPYAKTFRLWREARSFTNVILPGKSHLTAIAAPYMPPEYTESLVRFIDANDP